MKRFLIMLLALFVFALAAYAEDEAKQDPDPDKAAQEAEAKKKEEALARQAKAAINVFRKQLKSKKKSVQMQAIVEIGSIKHDLVIDELGTNTMKHRDPDVRDVAAQVLGDMKQSPELAGGHLRDNLMRNEDYPEVQRSIVRSIGKLGYTGALEQLMQAAKHMNEEKYKWVTVEVVRVFGVLKDNDSLPFLLWLAEYGGHTISWSTGEVVVDTGASGDADQRAAEAEWHRRYGGVTAPGPQPTLIRFYMQELAKTVKIITGHEFKNASEFRVWLVEHAKEFGLDPKELSRKGGLKNKDKKNKDKKKGKR